MVRKYEREIPFGGKRRVFVYLPKGYRNSDQRYPVFYMYDGHNLFFDDTATYGKSWGLKEYLDEHKTQIIAVGVECNHEGNERLCEYSPYSFKDKYLGKVTGRGKTTMDWMTSDLKQWVDETFRTLPEREHTYIGGSSMGGLMALWTIAAYNEVFSRAACVSSFIRYNHRKLLKELDREYLPDTRVYLSWGAKEFGSRRSLAQGTADNLDAANTLMKNGASVYLYQPLSGTHSEASWEKEIPVFMDFLKPEL